MIRSLSAIINHVKRIAWKIEVPVGTVFSRLTVIRELSERRKGHRCFECRCSCGKISSVPLARLRYGETKSCGCLSREQCIQRSTKHGRSDSSIYHIWRSMNDRCHTPTSKAYSDYGGRGIRVCAKWRNSFEAFVRDMGEHPPGLSLERRDNRRGYTPANVYWATPAQQTRNKRNNIFVTLNGERMLLIDAAAISGISAGTLRWRVEHGWNGEKLFRPVQ